MAKKKEKIVIEGIPLKAQTLGALIKKKNNIGRVIFIFIAFLIVIYFINDISVFLNNLLGRKTADTIVDNTTSNKNENNSIKDDKEQEEKKYEIISDDLIISLSGLTLSNFKNNNNRLTFDATNNSNITIDLSNDKYFLETYSNDYTLLERFKIDFNLINNNAQVSFDLAISKPFTYISIVEKNINDYPAFSITPNEEGEELLNCQNNIETIIYKFNKNELVSLSDTISDSNITDVNYYVRYQNYQNLVNGYKDKEGVIATFNATSNGYTAVISVDLSKANTSILSNKYYFQNKDKANIVNFEMETYGFTCN